MTYVKLDRISRFRDQLACFLIDLIADYVAASDRNFILGVVRYGHLLRETRMGMTLPLIRSGCRGPSARTASRASTTPVSVGLGR